MQRRDKKQISRRAFEFWCLEFTPTRIPASRRKSKRFEILRFKPPRVVIFLQREPKVAFEISRSELLRREFHTLKFRAINFVL